MVTTYDDTSDANQGMVSDGIEVCRHSFEHTLSFLNLFVKMS
jgi:hypothetical protein